MPRGEKPPENFQVIQGGDPLLDGMLQAARVEREYETGVRVVNDEWIQQALSNPDNGQLLEDHLRSFVGVGRRAPEQAVQVEAEAQAIIAAILDPKIKLTRSLESKRKRFLRSLDLLNPDLYKTQEKDTEERQ